MTVTAASSEGFSVATIDDERTAVRLPFTERIMRSPRSPDKRRLPKVFP